MSGPPAIVVDSSVAFKWFRSEGEDSVAAALALLRDHAAGKVELAAPSLMPVEVVGALSLVLEDEADVLAAADDLDAFGLRIVPIDAALLKRAVVIARTDRVAAYDAVFIALAESLGAALITADRRQATTTRCPVRLLV